MKTKLMQLPRSVLVGPQAIDSLCQVLSDLKLQGPSLVVADPTTYEAAGRRVQEVMGEELTLGVEIISSAIPSEVRRVERRLLASACRFAVAVGGGTVIDVTKLAARRCGIEFVSIPTAAAHDGIASSRASIKKKGASVSEDARAPIAIIADTEVIRKAPYRLLASGCGDIIAKHTSVKDWELARERVGEEFSEYAAALSLMSAKMLMNSPHAIKSYTEEGVRKVVKALISCGVAMSIAGSSRPASGSEHKFSHALDAVASFPALHGEQCGIGSIMMMRLHGGDWELIKDTLAAIGAPTTAAEIGVREEEVIEALVRARRVRPERYTILEEVKLTRKEAWALARETGVVG